MSDIDLAVSASNEVTRAWTAKVDFSQDTLISGFSAWSLLAALTVGATGPARSELQAVTGVEEAPVPNELWAALDDVAVGFGLWVRNDLRIREAFAAALPALTTGSIPADPVVLDRWVAAETKDMITELPSVISPEILLVLANVIALDVDWQLPFKPGAIWWAGEGPLLEGLQRQEPISHAAAIVKDGDQSISRFVCRSTTGIDVHLVAGSKEDDPAAVLRTALRSLDQDVVITPATELSKGDDAGCLRVEHVAGDEDRIRVELPSFSVRDEHELTDEPALFGIEAAMDASDGHFFEISPEPLAIEKMVQLAFAQFNETGFRAAAVTMVVMPRGAAALPEGRCKQVSVVHDRPFGFVAVHRATNLALFSGWVATPKACQPVD